MPPQSPVENRTPRQSHGHASVGTSRSCSKHRHIGKRFLLDTNLHVLPSCTSVWLTLRSRDEVSWRMVNVRILSANPAIPTSHIPHPTSHTTASDVCHTQYFAIAAWENTPDEYSRAPEHNMRQRMCYWAPHSKGAYPACWRPETSKACP